MKICARCNRKRRLTSFYKEKYGAQGVGSYCRDCNNDYRTEHRRTNEQYRVRNYRATRNARKKLLEEINQVKARARCADCKHKFKPWQMQFDHVRGKKLGHIARLVAAGCREIVMKEITKCEIVCANCHTDRTYRRLHGEVV